MVRSQERSATPMPSRAAPKSAGCASTTRCVVARVPR